MSLPSQPLPDHEWSFEAIGTAWWIGMYEPLATDQLRELQANIAERIALFDTIYSRFRDDSLVTKLAEKSGSYQFPDDAEQLFSFYRQLYEVTGGMLTPLIGQLLSDAGYDATYSLQPKPLRPIPEWDEVLRIKDGILATTVPVQLDFGAAGKGYLVDIIGGIIEQAGITKFAIDAGGDMLCQNVPDGLRIGLEHPADDQQVIGVATLVRGALCGSAGNRRAWDKYHHIMNPATLDSDRSLLAAWVYADTALVADGLATALSFTSPAHLSRTFAFEYLVIRDDMSLEQSPQFPAELFTRAAKI